MLQLNEISAGYSGRTVVASVSLTVETGRTACIVGPSGCGKTTLLTVAAGLMTPEAGEARLDGEPIAPGDRRVGLILQQYGLFPWFTARENVELGLRIRGAESAARRASAERELARMGLLECAERYPRELSGGQQQRVAIARSMALSPQLLLMDEPFSALDALTRESLQEMLLDALRQRKLSVLLVTHSIEEAVYLGAEVWLLSGAPGRVAGRFENPGQGSVGYRADPRFFQLCTRIRACMEENHVG
jgi:ABC-type nitrate/sulfonate/bicarbonate transport system ATPase subunit